MKSSQNFTEILLSDDGFRSCSKTSSVGIPNKHLKMRTPKSMNINLASYNWRPHCGKMNKVRHGNSVDTNRNNETSLCAPFRLRGRIYCYRLLSNVAKTALSTELRSQKKMQEDLRFPFRQFFLTFFGEGAGKCCSK